MSGHSTAEGDAAEQIWSAVQAMYRGFLAGDTRMIDRYIHPEATIWDSEQRPLLHGLGELAALRAARPTGAVSAVADLVAESPVIDVFGKTAVARHYLTVHFNDVGHPPQQIRNTGVWRLGEQGWLLVHNHEDLLASET